MLPYQFAFEDESFFRIRGDHAFDGVGLPYKFWNHLAIWIGSEVRPYSFVKSRCFANVEDFSLFRFEKIHTRFLRKIHRRERHRHDVGLMPTHIRQPISTEDGDEG